MRTAPICFLSFSINFANNISILTIFMTTSKYAHISNGSYELKAEHAEDVALLLARSFSQRNVIWAKENIQQMKLQEFFMKTIFNHLEQQEKTKKALGKDVFLSTIFIEDGYLSSALLHYDIGQYREKIKEPESSALPLLKILEKYGVQLIKTVDLNFFQAGKAAYINFGFHSTNGRAQTIPPHLGVGQHCSLLKKQGYRYILGRMSHEKTRLNYEMLGAKTTGQVSVDLGKGKSQSLYFIVLDMESQTYLKALAEIKVIRDRQNSERAKL